MLGRQVVLGMGREEAEYGGLWAEAVGAVGLAEGLHRDLPGRRAGVAAQHNAWLGESDLDAVAAPFVADSGAAEILVAYRELPIAGWHVHGGALQQDVLRALGALEPSARRQGKVNSVTRRPDGALVGAWVESPAEQFEVWTSQAPPTAPTRSPRPRSGSPAS